MCGVVAAILDTIGVNTWVGTQAMGARAWAWVLVLVLVRVRWPVGGIALREATAELREEVVGVVGVALLAAVGEVPEDARRDAYVEEQKE